MNILVLSWRGPKHPLAGGAELSTHEHAKAWVKAGHKVYLFTSKFKKGKSYEQIDGVEIIRKGKDVFGVQLSAFFWYLFGNHPKFDLVIDQFHGIPFFTPIYVRVKKLGFIHEVTREVWWLNPWPKPFNLIPGIVGTLFEPFVFKFFYKKIPFMTVSESTKTDLVKVGINPKNVTVIQNGATLVKTKSIRKERKKTAIFLGALSKDKGIEDAIEVFNLINQTQKNWQFWIVGKGSREYLKMLTSKSRKLGNSVKFWGYVDDRKKFELLKRAHVLINPSIREGWGLVNIEANSVSTPVVGYKVPGMVDSVKNRETGILVENGDSRMIANQTIELFSNNKQFKEMVTKSKAWGMRFTWNKACKRSLDLIESL